MESMASMIGTVEVDAAGADRTVERHRLDRLLQSDLEERQNRAETRKCDPADAKIEKTEKKTGGRQPPPKQSERRRQDAPLLLPSPKARYDLITDVDTLKTHKSNDNKVATESQRECSK